MPKRIVGIIVILISSPPSKFVNPLFLPLPLPPHPHQASTDTSERPPLLHHPHRHRHLHLFHHCLSLQLLVPINWCSSCPTRFHVSWRMLSASSIHLSRKVRGRMRCFCSVWMWRGDELVEEGGEDGCKEDRWMEEGWSEGEANSNKC